MMLGGLGFVGLQWLRPVAPLSVERLEGTPPKISGEAVASAAVPLQESAPTEVVVAVAGAVKRGGLVHLALGARVDDAVKAAGGGKPDADLEAINLAAKAVDGDQIYVPHRKAAEPARAEEKTKVSSRYRGGALRNAYAIHPIEPPIPPMLGGTVGGGPSSNLAPQEGEEASVAAAPETAPLHLSKAKASGPVSLNTGSEADFETLPGVGPATARKILDYRQAHGGFATVDEIQSVKGVGPKKFEKMKPFLKL